MAFLKATLGRALIIGLLLVVAKIFAPQIEPRQKEKSKDYSWVFVYLLGVAYYIFIGLPIIKVYENSYHAKIITVIFGNLMLLPAIAVIKHKQYSMAQVGLSTRHIKASLKVALAMSLLYFVYSYILEGRTLMITTDVLICSYQLVFIVSSAFVNEFIFRGFIQKRLVENYSVAVGILGSSLLEVIACMVLTVIYPNGQSAIIILSLFYGFMGNILYGYLAYKYDNIYGSVLIRIITNML